MVRDTGTADARYRPELRPHVCVYIYIYMCVCTDKVVISGSFFDFRLQLRGFCSVPIMLPTFCRVISVGTFTLMMVHYR